MRYELNISTCASEGLWILQNYYFRISNRSKFMEGNVLSPACN